MSNEEERPIQVLVVEDNAKDADKLIAELRGVSNPKCEVQHADRMRTALVKLREQAFDLVLLDLFLPESKGIKTLRRVRAAAPHTAVVAITRFDDEATGMEAVSEGAHDYLMKDEATGSALMRALRHALARLRVEEEIRKHQEQLRRTADFLRKANAELESFTYSVSHDLRTPLRAITGFSEILKMRYAHALDDDGQEYLDDIIKAGKLMGWLIDDLLAYSRIGRGEVPTEPVDLQPVLAKVEDGVVPRLEETGSVLEVAPSLPVVMGTDLLLTQIFSNLIVNGLNFHRPGVAAEVKVSWETDGGDALIHVTDNGIGIPEDQVERIFTVFTRLHTQEEYAGTGIGLAIVDKSVDLLGGSVKVSSTVGKGSTFTVRLAMPGADTRETQQEEA